MNAGDTLGKIQKYGLLKPITIIRCFTVAYPFKLINVLSNGKLELTQYVHNLLVR